MEVSDDGVGIDTSDAGRVRAGHLGLARVDRRNEDVGGILDIRDAQRRERGRG
jgi:signal transduction histidine kinase